jgi:DNA-binding response OmpR family regulator
MKGQTVPLSRGDLLPRSHIRVVRGLLGEPRLVSILIAQHDAEHARAVAALLAAAGFRVTLGGAPGDVEAFDGVILGTEDTAEGRVLTCQRLRRDGYLGAIVAFADDGDDAPALLDAGADDLVLSRDEAELVVRVRVALRRAATRARARWGHVEIDRVHRVAYLRGVPLVLTSTEYGLLCGLLDAAGDPVSRAELFAKVRGRNERPTTNVVDVHLSRLRDKLGDDAGLVETVRGFGYRLRRD